jgi:hypothetical protein
MSATETMVDEEQPPFDACLKQMIIRCVVDGSRNTILHIYTKCTRDIASARQKYNEIIVNNHCQQSQ